MNLNEYQWSGNPRGIHWDGSIIDLNTLVQHGFGVVKIVEVGSPAGPIDEALSLGITPIVRIYRREPGNAPPSPQMLQQYGEYLARGVKWFELYNEPNLNYEWVYGSNFDPREPSVMNPLMDNWLGWAEFIIGGGGYPGLPALAEADGEWEHNGLWIDRMLAYLHENHYDRFRNVLNNGCYIATHPGVLNHFYQQEPGGGSLSARPPERQNMNEGGWHFEYPYDPISQYSNPGVGVWGDPKGEPIGLTASGQAFMERLSDLFGVGAIPVMGTEGGIFVPLSPNTPTVYDSRYPPYTWQSHAHGTIAMFDWIVQQAPPWMFGVTLWTYSDYFRNPHGFPPVLDAFKARAPSFKTVPPLPAIERDPRTDPVVAEVEVNPIIVIPPAPGPGAVHGVPDYHFIYIAPGVNPDWFFEHAHPYWDRFLPDLITNLEFIGFMNSEVSLVLTVICPPNLVDSINQQTIARWINIWLDMVVVDSAADLGEVFNERAESGKRFG